MQLGLLLFIFSRVPQLKLIFSNFREPVHQCLSAVAVSVYKLI